MRLDDDLHDGPPPPTEDTAEVPIDRQARSLVMRAAKLRLEAREAEPGRRAALLDEANHLEADALRMAFG